MHTPITQLTAQSNIETGELIKSIELWNEAYRNGEPLVSDDLFDTYITELETRDPAHPLLTAITPSVTESLDYQHSTPMLSTDKVYTQEELGLWFDKVIKAAQTVGIQDPLVECSPKLDGLAGRLYLDGALVTRGSGTAGTDIRHLLQAGLKVLGDTSRELTGEIVVNREYFAENLSLHFANERSFISGMAGATNGLNQHFTKALQDGAVHLVSFADLTTKAAMPLSTLRGVAESVEEMQLTNNPYLLDGVVFAVVDPQVREIMGTASDHNRYEVAKKRKGETAETTITEITWQVGRDGKQNPVLTFEEVSLSGVNITRCTAHHAGNVLESGLGVGARVEIIRSGEVVPNLHAVCTPVEPSMPAQCACCGHELKWKAGGVARGFKPTYLVCHNSGCDSRKASRLLHHLDTIKVLNFGLKTVDRLVHGGFDHIESLYEMDKFDLVAMGFGEGQSTRLIESFNSVRNSPIDDNLVVASLGIDDLGRRAAKKLLKHFRLEEMPYLTIAQIAALEGFGETSGYTISMGLYQNKQLLEFLIHDAGLNIQHTQDEQPIEVAQDSYFKGLNVVFTGTCKLSRSEMGNHAASQGANVLKDISGKKADYLVCGAKVGAKKMQKATAAGVKVITQDEYFDLCGNGGY
ncbi:hypothetical protein [Photobacterium lutimaris]|uniref:DNA ligase (NAD(+)) n=1 Tax=Photobacterium lutimaris TaxID=388278 RepID=A0A2T3ITH8_9GAMM|nr:hypothetical protein [Photobacterium lutimaris]PSU31664.1 hypothetical protein C9I99_20980 [Photobacterium lutimaris]TDR72702.1 DNA ligase (NAD+) [Photobacterium lutimaris]